MTKRASSIGCATPYTNETDPALESSDMTAASRVTLPSRSGQPQRPTVLSALNASVILQPETIASKGEPPFLNIFVPSTLAGSPCFQVDNKMKSYFYFL